MPNHNVSADIADAWGLPTVLAQTTGTNPASPLMMGSGPEAGATGTATPGTPGTAAPASGTPSGQPGGLGPIIWLLPLVFLFIILMSGGAQRKEKKRMAALMSQLKKQDRVLTIGGIIGTVVEVRDDEIVLKIDENSNTRVRFTKNAIQQVLKASEASLTSSGNEPKIEVRAGKGEKATV
jgi:preprotein translocase subunit YajC